MSFPARVAAAWRALVPEQRLAAMSSGALFVAMFTPWYEKNTDAVVRGRLEERSDTLSAFEAFSFVEAAVLLVGAGVLALLFARGERRSFHLPGGDGTVVMAAGAWSALLIFIRQLDKPDGERHTQITTTIGVHWGIFVAFTASIALGYAGFRMRAAHLPEPGGEPPPGPLSADDATAATAVTPAAARSRARRRGGAPQIDGGEQLSFDEQE